MSRRLNIAALALGLMLLAVGPLALTLARASSYHASDTIAFNPENDSAPLIPRPARLVAAPLEVTDLQENVAKKVGWFDAPEDLSEYVSVEERRAGGRTTFVVTGRGPSPEEASELAEVAAAALLDAAEVSARFVQQQQLQLMVAALRRDGLGQDERAELLQRREPLRKALARDTPVFAASTEEPALESERIGDRLLGALPGSRPLRPDPVWAGLAGVALALAVGLWVMALSSGRPRAG
jgi:hypothetical protein